MPAGHVPAVQKKERIRQSYNIGAELRGNYHPRSCPFMLIVPAAELETKIEEEKRDLKT